MLSELFRIVVSFLYPSCVSSVTFSCIWFIISVILRGSLDSVIVLFDLSSSSRYFRIFTIRCGTSMPLTGSMIQCAVSRIFTFKSLYLSSTAARSIILIVYDPTGAANSCSFFLPSARRLSLFVYRPSVQELTIGLPL